jgi:hypothetical protein
MQSQPNFFLRRVTIKSSVDISSDQGYAFLPQTDSGLHMRQRSRAFIVADASNSTNRFVFINAGQSAVSICNTGSYSRLASPT